MQTEAALHTTGLRQGIAVEVITIGWMLIEAAVAIGAGVAAHSIVLVAFGIDSVIELTSGAILLWRLTTEARRESLERVERAERLASWGVGIALALLCVYVLASGLAGLLLRNQPERSGAGIALAAAAFVVMPLLARRKRILADRLGSAALRGDAACSITCAYMAATLLLGLALNAVLGWWWADSLAALALLVWLVPEARETLESARAGRGGCACGDE